MLNSGHYSTLSGTAGAGAVPPIIEMEDGFRLPELIGNVEQFARDSQKLFEEFCSLVTGSLRVPLAPELNAAGSGIGAQCSESIMEYSFLNALLDACPSFVRVHETTRPKKYR